MFPRTLGLCLVMSSLCLLPQSGGASAPVEALLRRAEAVRSSDPKAFQQLLASLEVARRQATPKQREQLDYLNAYRHVFDGQYELAIKEARQLVDSSVDVEMQYRAGALLVNAYALTQKFTEGFRQLDQTLSLAGRVKNPELRQHGRGVATVIYNQVGQYKLALHYADVIVSETTSKRTLCLAKQSRMYSQQNLGLLSPDDAPIIQLIKLCNDQGEKAAVSFVHAALARKWAAEGRRDKAIALLREHMPEVEATRYPRLIGEVKALLAQLLLAHGDFRGAESYARATIGLGASIANSLPLVEAHRTMYEIAQQRTDPVAALYHYRRYAEADKAYLSDIKARDLAYQIVREETLQKTQQIERLHGENQLLLLQQRVDQQANQNTRLMVLMLVLLVALIGYWAYKVKRVQQSLRRFAETDALTGISNRHHFTMQAEAALAQSAADGEACALIMFDLDHFKQINDSYGHDIGDWVLKQVARTCEDFCRRIDQFGRLGGEEFAILLRGIDLPSATRLAEDCRVRLTQIDSRESGHAFVVTASFGVSATPTSGYGLAKLLSHADQMLYSGKRSGRNRVNTYTGEPFPHPLQLQVVPKDGDGHAKRAG